MADPCSALDVEIDHPALPLGGMLPLRVWRVWPNGGRTPAGTLHLAEGEVRLLLAALAPDRSLPDAAYALEDLVLGPRGTCLRVDLAGARPHELVRP